MLQRVSKKSFALLTLLGTTLTVLAQKSDQPSENDGNQVTWDSYSEGEKNLDVANEVTKGVRVEDIVEKPYDYHYAAFGKGDPFAPPMLASAAVQKIPNVEIEIPIVSVLQKYPVQELKVVGVWELKNQERKVLIMTPSDEGVTAKIGDTIGQKGGKILNITKTEVVVREFTLTPDGTREFSDVTLVIGNHQNKDEKKVIVMKAGGKEQEAGYKVDELLPAGILDNDPDQKAIKDAAIMKEQPVIKADDKNAAEKVAAPAVDGKAPEKDAANIPAADAAVAAPEAKVENAAVAPVANPADAVPVTTEGEGQENMPEGEKPEEVQDDIKEADPFQ